MELPKRKQIRLCDYDYSQNGTYFVTICTHHRQHLFSVMDVGAAPCGRPNPANEIAEKWIEKLPDKFPDVRVDSYVILLNHIHVLIGLQSGDLAGGHMGPPLQEIVDWYKTMTTNDYIRAVREKKLSAFRGKVWQRGYYEHIVRNEHDYLDIWQYIDQNPARWAEDEYYGEER